MSNTYQMNEFGEVVHYNCGRRMDNGREPTEFETQLIDEIGELTVAKSEAVQAFADEVRKNEQLSTERSDLIKSIREILVRPSLSALHRANNKLPDELKIAELRELGFVEDLVSGTELPK